MPLVSRSRPRLCMRSNSTVSRFRDSFRARSSSAPRPAYASTHPSQAAVAAPAARLRAHVADLAGRAAPGQQAAVDHEPTPDARPPEDPEEGSHPLAGPEASLRLHRDAHVVPEHGRHPERRGDRRRERERLVQALDVRDLKHRPRRGVDASGGADPDTRELAPAQPRPRRRRHEQPGRSPRRRPPGRHGSGCPAGQWRGRGRRRRRRPPGSSFLRGRRPLSRKTPHDLGEGLPVRAGAPLLGAARRDLTEPLGDPEGEHDRDVLLLGNVERDPDLPRRPRSRSGTTRDRRSRRRAACSGPRDPHRTSPALCPSRRSRRPARPSGCWSARRPCPRSARVAPARSGRRTSTAGGSSRSPTAGRRRGCARRRRPAADRDGSGVRRGDSRWRGRCPRK